MKLLAIAIESSAVVRAARGIARESVLVAAIRATAQWIGRISARVPVGVGDRLLPKVEHAAAEHITPVAAGSRVVVALETCVTAPERAWRYARARDTIAAVSLVSPATRVRQIGWMLIIAVLTHTMLLAALGSPVRTLGWSIRVGVMGFGMLLWSRADAAAMAWSAKVGHRR